MTTPWWKTAKGKRVRKKYTRLIKAECKKREHRPEYQVACWNYLHKKWAAKIRREARKP